MFAYERQAKGSADDSKRFTGPKITLSVDDLTEEQADALAVEGLDVEDVKPAGLAGTDAAKKAEAASSSSS